MEARLCDRYRGGLLTILDAIEIVRTCASTYFRPFNSYMAPVTKLISVCRGSIFGRESRSSIQLKAVSSPTKPRKTHATFLTQHNRLIYSSRHSCKPYISRSASKISQATWYQPQSISQRGQASAGPVQTQEGSRNKRRI